MACHQCICGRGTGRLHLVFLLSFEPSETFRKEPLSIVHSKLLNILEWEVGLVTPAAAASSLTKFRVVLTINDNLPGSWNLGALETVSSSHL